MRDGNSFPLVCTVVTGNFGGQSIVLCMCSGNVLLDTNIAIPTCTSDFSPVTHYPDTHSKNFSLSLGSIIPCCLYRMSGNTPGTTGESLTY